MAEVTWRIARSKPPVNRGMYQTMYMMDYKPYSDGHQQPPTSVVDHAEKLTLEAQLKAKEFAQPFTYEPVKYAEDPPCQEVQPPFPTGMERRWGHGQDVPPPAQPVKEAQQKDFHTVLPAAQDFLQLSPLVQSVAAPEKEAERLRQPTDPDATPDNKAVPCVTDELGQNWANYQQFLLESHRARHTQAQEIKKLGLGCSVLQEDFVSGAEASTYQQDYRYWPRVRTGFCRAQRNFSNLLFEDGYYNEMPWMSEYMDNHGIFLQKLKWKSRNPASSFCSAIKPVPQLPHRMSLQTPIIL